MINVGIDIIEIKRIEKSALKARFLERVFSEVELTLFSHKKNPYESLAGNWAAKEAFVKALGTGFRDIEMNEISVLRNELGMPYLELTGKALEHSNGLSFSVSISHTKEIATAIVIAYKE